jgi:hypothetical protein
MAVTAALEVNSSYRNTHYISFFKSGQVLHQKNDARNDDEMKKEKKSFATVILDYNMMKT